MKKYNVAIIGATGNVGTEIIETLYSRNFPINNIHAVASNESLGKKIFFGDKTISVTSLEYFDFNDIDIVFASCGSNVSKTFSDRITQNGILLIDEASIFRVDDEIPLIIPEINSAEIACYKNKNIIASPNCCVIPIAMVLYCVSQVSRIKRIVASTYQSTSGAGRKAMDELFDNSQQIIMGETPEVKHFPKQIAFNVIPQIGDFDDDGNTSEEYKIIQELYKILCTQTKSNTCDIEHNNTKNGKVSGNKLDQFNISVTCVRVPVFLGHAISLNIEFESNIKVEEIVSSLKEFDGIKVVDLDGIEQYATHSSIIDEDCVLVSRIRKDNSIKNGINMWIVVDNLRKGAALNMVQIAEKFIS